MDKLRTFLQNVKHPKARSLAGFALAKASMDFGEDEAAMEMLHAAHSDQASTAIRVYDPDAMDHEIRRLRKNVGALTLFRVSRGSAQKRCSRSL